ncbi:MAG TPA: hypothetical protein VGS59_13975 [Candidatus Acidoferrales bacterium]|nr:hypothetical protein [Candidatus Acidoferrales bacterium]
MINEWLWEDASGVNGPEPQKTVFLLINKLATSEHRIVLIEGSPFDQKAWRLCKGDSAIVRAIVKVFVNSLRQNIDRCQILKSEPAVPIPEELAAATKHDDHYLLEAQQSVQGSIIVTTDGTLCEAVRKACLPCLFREEFLENYFQPIG